MLKYFVKDKNVKEDKFRNFEEKITTRPIKFSNAVKIESLKLFIV